MKLLNHQEALLSSTSAEGLARAVRFNADGEYCLICGSDKNLYLWNPYKKLLLNTYIGHGQEVLDADSSADSSQLTSCSSDRTVNVWDVATGKSIRKFRGHHSKVNCVSFNKPDASLVFSGSYDCTLRIWDCRSRSMEAVQVLDDAKDSVSSTEVSENEILVGSVDGYVRVYDIRKGQLKEYCMGKPVTCVSFSSDRQCILVSSLPDSISLLDKDIGSILNAFTGHSNKEYKIESLVTQTDSHVISGSEDGCVFVWDLVKAEVTQRMSKSGSGVVYSISLHPSKTVLLTAGVDGVNLWSNEDEDEDDSKN